MSGLDFLLNLAALLLWLSWRGIGTVHASGPAGTLLGNLKPAERRPGVRHSYLLGLLLLLFVRAVVYRQFGPAFDWNPSWSPGAVRVVFRSDYFWRMLASSVLGFAWMWFGLFASVCLVMAVNRPPQDKDGVTRELRRSVGWISHLPGVLWLFVPSVLLGLAWLLLGWWAAVTGLVPALHHPAHLFQQSIVVGLGAVLVWRWLLTVVLGLNFLNSYVFFGSSPFWDFVQHTGNRLVRPLAWTRMGRVNLPPLIALALVWLGFSLLGSGLPILKHTFPGLPQWVESGVFPRLYRSLPW
jgi:hypothetical protein